MEVPCPIFHVQHGRDTGRDILDGSFFLPSFRVKGQRRRRYTLEGGFEVLVWSRAARYCANDRPLPDHYDPYHYYSSATAAATTFYRVTN